MTAEKWEELSAFSQLGKKKSLLMIQAIFSSFYTFFADPLLFPLRVGVTGLEAKSFY